MKESTQKALKEAIPEDVLNDLTKVLKGEELKIETVEQYHNVGYLIANIKEVIEIIDNEKKSHEPEIRKKIQELDKSYNAIIKRLKGSENTFKEEVLRFFDMKSNNGKDNSLIVGALKSTHITFREDKKYVIVDKKKAINYLMENDLMDSINIDEKKLKGIEKKHLNLEEETGIRFEVGKTVIRKAKRKEK